MFNLGFYHIFITFTMVFQLSVSIVFALVGLSGPLALIIGGAVYFALPVFMFIKLSSQRVTDVLEFRRVSGKNLLYILAISVAVYPPALILSAITSIFFTNHVPEVVGGMAARVNPLIMFAALGLSPAFFEEILLRGMMGKPLKHLGFKGALLNGLYFGLIHLNPHQFFYAFALGVLLYYMLILSGSIWAPMLSHLIINSIALTLFLLGPRLAFLDGYMTLGFFMAATVAFVILLKCFIQDNREKLLPNDKSERIITPSFFAMLGVYFFIIFSFSLF